MENFTEIPEIEAVTRMPRRGKLKLGEKVPYTAKSGPDKGKTKERPVELDYFKCPPEVIEVLMACKQIKDDKPKEIPISLPSNDKSEIMPYAFKWYKGSAGMYCKGNGTIANRAKDGTKEKGFAFEERPCPGAECPAYQKGDCKLSANLFVLLPHVDTFLTYQIDTNSWHSVVNILNGLQRIQDQYGRLMNLHHPETMEPILRLGRMPKETHGSGRKETHYIMYIRAEMPLSLLRQIREGLSNPNLLSAPTPKLRPPGETKNEYKERIKKACEDLWGTDQSKEIPEVIEPEVVADDEQVQTVLDRIAKCVAIPELKNVFNKYVSGISWHDKDCLRIEDAGRDKESEIIKALKNKDAGKEFSEATKLQAKIHKFAARVKELNPTFAESWLSGLCKNEGSENGIVEEVDDIKALERIFNNVEAKGKELGKAQESDK